jgi:hypothetical protein
MDLITTVKDIMGGTAIKIQFLVTILTKRNKL